MRVIIDDAAIREVERRAVDELRPVNVRRVMLETLEPFAEEERSGHAYRNRTGFLEASTQAEPLAGGDPEVQFVAGPFETNPLGQREYASFVNNRGLMRIDELAGEAEDAIFEALERVGDER